MFKTFLLFACVVLSLPCESGWAVEEKKSDIQSQPLKPWLSFESMHADNVRAFIKSPGLGMSRLVSMIEIAERDEARSLAAALSRPVVTNEQRYAIKSIELIGVARHDPPVVFRSPIVHPVHGTPDTDAVTNGESELPKQQATSQQETATSVSQVVHPVRALTEDEQASLTIFRKGGDLVLHRERNDRIVLGPIRARQDCIRCHEGTKVGDVLGAFRYRLSEMK